eukprot:CAMPEP_0179149862 /NCGR_PEP_ID=MMETSP0796-20121207/72632_1 /TAXON_ID=73915 /ORGANISM="Pyrodinium bahamense, Strain pbaha01" /LENGTH=117 /DNA_ID=CAMNT_0020850753 /DNA_START=499 /DNA_END=849 /DNA_ORIENTATION=+
MVPKAAPGLSLGTSTSTHNEPPPALGHVESAASRKRSPSRNRRHHCPAHERCAGMAIGGGVGNGGGTGNGGDTDNGGGAGIGGGIGNGGGTGNGGSPGRALGEMVLPSRAATVAAAA